MGYDLWIRSSGGHAYTGRLLTEKDPHNGAWLIAVPCATIGTHPTDKEFSISIGLRLGDQNYVWSIDADVANSRMNWVITHWLAVPHVMSPLNGIFRRAPNTACYPSILEPVVLDRVYLYSKRPDSMTLYPFTSGVDDVWFEMPMCCTLFATPMSWDVPFLHLTLQTRPRSL